MPPAVRPLATGRALRSLALLVSFVALTVGCTRTTDLAADVQVDQSTTTLRLPVRHVPRATTTTGAPAAEASPTSVPPAPAAVASEQVGATPVSNGGFFALADALQRAKAAGAITTTTRPPSVPPTTAAPAPTTTTTALPALNPHILAAAQAPVAGPGEAQVFQILVDIALVGPVQCAGRDYVLAASGWVAASFSTPVDCPTDQAPSLRRTLPATAPSGQYAFCTEIDPESPTTVCALYSIRPASV